MDDAVSMKVRLMIAVWSANLLAGGLIGAARGDLVTWLFVGLVLGMAASTAIGLWT